MRVVSLVPSWTETLIEAKVEVVGRTRFCIHPASKVGAIAQVGGTKDWKWDQIVALKPDLLLLDKEENPKFMAEQNQVPTLATHVTNLQSVPTELRRVGAWLNNPRLIEMADEWAIVLNQTRPPLTDWEQFPGVIAWGQRPTLPIQRVIYVIWKNPWLRVAPQTFIGSVLERLGCGAYVEPSLEKYPIFRPQDYDPAQTLLLFSSEPYPFLRQRAEAAELKFPHAFVDGESFSWFGVRNFRFLTKA